MPRSGFVLRQVGFGQSLGQIAAKANFLVVRHKASDRFAILQKHEGHVLIMSPAKLRDASVTVLLVFFTNLILRSSDLPDDVKTAVGRLK